MSTRFTPIKSVDEFAWHGTPKDFDNHYDEKSHEDLKALLAASVYGAIGKYLDYLDRRS
jgi:hypothetical protein